MISNRYVNLEAWQIERDVLKRLGWMMYDEDGFKILVTPDKLIYEELDEMVKEDEAWAIWYERARVRRIAYTGNLGIAWSLPIDETAFEMTLTRSSERSNEAEIAPLHMDLPVFLVEVPENPALAICTAWLLYCDWKDAQDGN